MNLFLFLFKSSQDNKREKQVGKQDHYEANAIVAQCQLNTGEPHRDREASKIPNAGRDENSLP